MAGLQWWAPRVWRSLGLAEEVEAVPAVPPLPAALTQDHPPAPWLGLGLHEKACREAGPGGLGSGSVNGC